MQTLNGNFDGISQNILEGWVCDDSNKGKTFSIDLFIDHKFVGTYDADLFREDLLEAGIGKGCNSFKVSIPLNFLDDNEHHVELKLNGLDVSVPNSPKVLKFSRLSEADNNFRSCVEKISNGILEGWIFDTNNPEDLINLNIYENGNLLANIKADAELSNIDNKFGSNVNHGFSYVMPRELYDLKAHDIEIFIANTEQKIHETKILFDGHPKYEGFLETIEGLFVRGWAREITCSDEIVKLSVLVDGEFIDHTSADIFREDLLKAKPGNGFYGFSFKIPDHFDDGKEHSVNVLVAQTDINLKRSPSILKPFSAVKSDLKEVSDAPYYEGNFERISGHIIFGWVWDIKAPGRALKVDLYVDNEFITANSAQNFRADLLKAAKGTGKHGFNFEIPERFFDGMTHKIEIKVAGTDVALSGSPKIIQLGTTAVKHNHDNKNERSKYSF